MKIINTALFISIFSFNVNAAFTEPEMSQLAEINQKSIEKTKNARHLLDITIKKTIEHLPKQKEKILKLEKSWNTTIKQKCRVMIFESINTDAEIAQENTCLSAEYTSAAEFFENLNG